MKFFYGDNDDDIKPAVKVRMAPPIGFALKHRTVADMSDEELIEEKCKCRSRLARLSEPGYTDGQRGKTE